MFALPLVLRFLSSSSFLVQLILAIPLAFEVGGRNCGLAFTLALSNFYLVLSTLRLVTKRTPLSIIPTLLAGCQHVIIPSLLIYYLNEYYADGVVAAWWQSIFLRPWGMLLMHSTPLFTLMEGLASLLLIQAFGRVSRWLVNNRSDTWLIIMLVGCGGVISGALYSLYRIYNFPVIGTVNSTLIGVALTASIFLCIYGTASGRGNIAESSLMFAYTVYSIYMVCTDFQPAGAPHRAANPDGKSEFPPFPPLIMESYASVAASLASALPDAFFRSFDFVSAAANTITPSVVTSLIYRIIVLAAATRIIPALREASRSLSASPSSSDLEPSSRLMNFFITYSPSILIAVYTHLVMQHFGMIEHGPKVLGIAVGSGQAWRWINCFATLALYAGELVLGDEEMGVDLVEHWKVE
ncbi:hypothetical protein YB2330_002872 [Saitoella coloradoensis]